MRLTDFSVKYLVIGGVNLERTIGEGMTVGQAYQQLGCVIVVVNVKLTNGIFDAAT
mgnify:CR=1 FL=1